MPDIIDWPASRAFGVAGFTLGLDVPEFGATGVYTGNRTRRSALADRLTATLTVPPALHPADVAEREAFMLHLRSTGSWLRMRMPHRLASVGNVRGTLTCAANAAAGARSIQIAGARAGVNLLASSGFELDSNADGIADGWAAFNGGSVSGVAYSLVTGNGTPLAQRCFATSLGAGGGDIVGVRRGAAQPVTAGLPYTLAVDCIGNVATFAVRLYVDWFNAGASLIGSSQAAAAAPTTWTRRTLTATAPAGAASATVSAWMEGAGATVANALLWLDNVQFEQAAAATAYAGLPRFAPGDLLGLPNDAIAVVAPPGATGTDAGAITVPLALPLQRAVASAAGLSWLQPLSLWELEPAAVSLDYSAPVLQAGFALPLRQVFQT